MGLLFFSTPWQGRNTGTFIPKVLGQETSTTHLGHVPTIDKSRHMLVFFLIHFAQPLVVCRGAVPYVHVANMSGTVVLSF